MAHLPFSIFDKPILFVIPTKGSVAKFEIASLLRFSQWQKRRFHVIASGSKNRAAI